MSLPESVEAETADGCNGAKDDSSTGSSGCNVASEAEGLEAFGGEFKEGASAFEKAGALRVRCCHRCLPPAGGRSLQEECVSMVRMQ